MCFQFTKDSSTWGLLHNMVLQLVPFCLGHSMTGPPIGALPLGHSITGPPIGALPLGHSQVGPPIGALPLGHSQGPPVGALPLGHSKSGPSSWCPSPKGTP